MLYGLKVDFGVFWKGGSFETIKGKGYMYTAAVSTDGSAKPVKSRDSGDEDPVLRLVCTFYKDLYYARGIKMIKILFVCWGITLTEA